MPGMDRHPANHYPTAADAHTPEEIVARIIRVDHAGEYGAARIYEGQLAVLGRIDDVDAASQHGNRCAASVEGPLMRLAVDSARQPADDGKALGRELKAQPLRHSAPDIAARARADDRDTIGASHLGGAADEQERRRVCDLAQVGRIVGVSPFDQARAEIRQLAQFLFERLEVAELRDILRRVAGNPGGRDLVGAELEYFLRRAELLDQQLAGARTDAARPSQCEPIDVC